MAYTESLFVLLLVGAMFAMERGARPVLIAAIIGLATACRPVGIGLMPVFAIYLWRQTTGWREYLTRAPALLLFSCWGVAAYMLFQLLEFADPLAFVKAQQHWAHPTRLNAVDQVQGTLTGKAIWSVYDSSSVAYWARHDPHGNPLISLQFANPIYFLATAGLIFVGARKRWLNWRECLLAGSLLAITYATHGYRALMMAQGRYAASVFPVYIVLGQLALRAPRWVVVALCVLSALLLAAYAALFAAWYRIT
jgi:hypothetical protein